MPSLSNGTALAVPATHQTTDPPDAETEGVFTGRYGRVRLLVGYEGVVTSCRLRLWVRTPDASAWAEDDTTDDGEPLSPEGQEIVESRMIEVGTNTEFAVQVEAIAPGTSGNTVTVHAVGVEV